MDAGSRCGKGFQIRERSGNTQTFFLCAATPEFLCWGGLVYSDAAARGNDGGGAGPPGARTGRESCPLRGDHPAGTARSLDIASAGGGNFSWDLGCVSAAARSHRTVWRDVVCGVAEYPRVGAAHGAWRGRIQSLAPGYIARLGVNGRRSVARRRGGIGVDAMAWEPPIQGKPVRPTGIRVRPRGNDDGRTGSVFLARLARNPNRSSPGVARLILYKPLPRCWRKIRLAMRLETRLAAAALYGCNPDRNLTSYARPTGVPQRRSRWTRRLRRRQIRLRRPHLKLPSQRSFNWTEGLPFHRSFVLRGLLPSPASSRRLGFLSASQSYRPS